ncbi:MAG TPA: HAMP domain-containing sensor histidine kinase, partial [Candidatus Paceibacterota bacterium]|nr:HAMP domain-containing sensor histidine kinase [Candidatus Paceibacterota bacterium]
MVVFLVAHLVISNEGWNPVAIYIILGAGLILVSFAIGGRVLAHIRHIVRAQKRFIADASHELRTPLAIMKTNTEVALLGSDDTNKDELASILKENLAEIDRMSKIIENLLGLSYYDNRYAEIPLMPIELAKIAGQITERARSLAVKKSIDLQLLNADPGMIRGNPIALEQMAINLIKNAVTYTEPGGKVSVSVNSRDDGYLEFKVKDSGIGIAKEDLKHVFNPFYKSGRGRVQLERE